MQASHMRELIARAQFLAQHGDDSTTRELAQEVERWAAEARRHPFDQAPEKQLCAALVNLRDHLATVDAAAETGTD